MHRAVVLDWMRAKPTSMAILSTLASKHAGIGRCQVLLACKQQLCMNAWISIILAVPFIIAVTR
jgi:hypothetical protein